RARAQAGAPARAHAGLDDRAGGVAAPAGRDVRRLGRAGAGPDRGASRRRRAGRPRRGRAGAGQDRAPGRRRHRRRQGAHRGQAAMTYTTQPARRPAPTYAATGGLLSFITEPWKDLSTALFGAPTDDACMAKAKAATAELDRQTNALAATWRPAGMLQVDGVRRLRGATYALVQEPSAAIDGSIQRGAPQAARDLLTDRLWKI